MLPDVLTTRPRDRTIKPVYAGVYGRAMCRTDDGTHSALSPVRTDTHRFLQRV